MEITCNHSELKLRCRNPEELEVFIHDFGRKGKYVEFVITQDTFIKCLPLSGSMKCDHVKGKKMIGEIIAKIGKKTNFGYVIKARVTGKLCLGSGGRFMLTASSINFPGCAKCPIEKNCIYMEPLSAATPVPDVEIKIIHPNIDDPLNGREKIAD